MSAASEAEKRLLSLAIEVLIERLDQLDGDADMEPDCDDELVGDEQEPGGDEQERYPPGDCRLLKFWRYRP